MEKHILNLLQNNIPKKIEIQNVKKLKNSPKESKEIKYKNDAIFSMYHYPLKSKNINENKFSI